MVTFASTARRQRLALILAAVLAVGAASAVAAAAQNDSSPQPGSKTTGKPGRPPVAVEVTPATATVNPSPCGVVVLDVAMTNDTDVALYTDVFIARDGPLEVSRSVVSSYLPPGYTVEVPVQVRAGDDADPGTYDVTVDGGRKPATTPITVADLSEVDNLALLAEPSASSTMGNFSVCGAVDGDRDQSHWSSLSGWADATRAEFPDWYQLTFAEPQRIGTVEVVTRASPSLAMRDWDVQVMIDEEWVTVSEVRDNVGEVVRSTFDPVETDALRVLVVSSNDGLFSRILELEVYSP